MPTIIVQWPDKTLTMLRMPRDWEAVDLYEELDQEADPLAAKVWIASGRFYVGVIQGEVHCYEGRLKKWKWPPDTLDVYMSRIKDDAQRLKDEEDKE